MKRKVVWLIVLVVVGVLSIRAVQHLVAPFWIGIEADIRAEQLQRDEVIREARDSVKRWCRNKMVPGGTIFPAILSFNGEDIAILRCDGTIHVTTGYSMEDVLFLWIWTTNPSIWKGGD